MSDRTKKIILIVVFLVLTLVFGYLLYYLLLRPLPTPTLPANANANVPGGLPTAGLNANRPTYINVNGKLIPATNLNVTPPPTASPIALGGSTQVKTLADAPASGATMSANGQDLLYYNKNDGKFYRIDANGNVTLLSDKVFYNVEQIYWAPNKEKAILTYPDGSNITYDFQTQKQYTLPKQWKDFSFSPTSDKIVLKNWTVDEEDRFLSIANDDGTGYRRIETLGRQDKNVHVDWSPNRQVIATFNEGIDLERQYLYFIGQNKERFNVAIIEGRDFRPIWSPTGETVLYSVYHSSSNLNPTLWVVDGKGENIGKNRVPLNLQTWADKCTFIDATTIYCAVPQKLERGSGLVPDYAANVPDDFYKIDLKNYTKSVVAIPDGSYNAKNLTVSQDGKYLYFTDQLTGKLQQIRLK
jgi:hypothetical protein